ncbi:uncharacterized protein [Solanum tuberosum]|uniref:uncharacterized protein n=1 Tax=Solanum tuberosum TaxID=4113 RepID=UPI00073A104D|nr:PREDICTED: uncharacterized protein LOC107058543 [Solanum tuberosum]
MVAPPSMEEGQSTTRPPHYNGQFYGRWKMHMHDYINAEDTELWDVILDGPYIPTKDVVDGELTKVIPKTRRKYNEAKRKKIENNYRAKKLLVCRIGPDEYNRSSACETTKEIWDCLKTTHKGMTQVNESKVHMVTTQYENFCTKEGETIHEMNTRFTSITNELRCLGEPIHPRKQVRKILRVLPKSWESKVNVITEVRDLNTLTMDDLIGNLQTYELNRQQRSNVKERKKEKSVALKISLNDVLEDEDEMAYLTKRDCQIQKQEAQDFKPHRRDQVLNHARRKAHIDQVVKKAFAVWGNGSSESEEEEDSHEDVSMMFVKDDEIVFNSIFLLMAKSDDEENQDKKRGSSQSWYMDSGCSRHMTGYTQNFLFLEAHQGGGLSFGDGKKGFSLVIGKIGSSAEHSTDNVYYVNDIDSIEGDSFTCLSAQTDNANLWHRKLGHVSFSLLNKLVAGDLVHGLPRLKFSDNKVCEACVKGKQTRFTWNMFLRTKDETAGLLITFAKAIQLKVNYKIASIRSDHGTEFENT